MNFKNAEARLAKDAQRRANIQATEKSKSGNSSVACSKRLELLPPSTMSKPCDPRLAKNAERRTNIL
jgi:hypothetical protein